MGFGAGSLGFRVWGLQLKTHGPSKVEGLGLSVIVTKLDRHYCEPG